MIPKIIHTYYISNNSKFDKITEWVSSLQKQYPEFEIKTWDIALYDCDKKNHYCKDCLSCGEIGYLYLSYLIRFNIIKKYGGFFLEPFVELKRDYVEKVINKNFAFEVINYDNININYFAGIASEMFKDNPFNKIINKLSTLRLINNDGSLNLFNPNHIVGRVLKTNDYNFSDVFGDKQINSIYFTYNILNLNEYYSIPEIYKKEASIVLPVYNGEKYIKSCIESILNQSFTNFELLCIDDGSTDNTKDIIKSFNDERIIYIRKEHTGIVDTLNLGLKRAIGKYIIRHDADDIMFQNRIEYQINFMKNHPDIDILSNGFESFANIPGDGKIIYSNPVGYVSLDMLIHKNHLSHPSSCFKRSSIMSLPFQYEQYYEHAEDYKLWLTAAAHGLKIYSDGECLIYYRKHQNSITSTSNDSMWRSANLASNAYKNKNKEGNELTCIIPFQNEGQEVERTVASIRGTSNNVNIMLINDCSTDGFNYKLVADIYGCEYIETEKNLGVAGCRDFAISLCKTEYFLLLDAHMRFYDMCWDEKLMIYLKTYQDAIITGNTLVFSYNISNDIYKGELQFNYENCNTRAAIINDYEDGWMFTGKWTNNEMPGYKNENLIPISCCMGAVYASNKTWWNKIDGLKGLAKWGQDEPYISIKTWLAGGKVFLIKDWCVGHLYRDMSAYLVPSNLKLRNRIFLINFFYHDENKITEQLNHLEKLVGKNKYKEALNEYFMEKDNLLKLKNHFWSNIAVKDLEWFLTEINKPIKENKGKRN